MLGCREVEHGGRVDGLDGDNGHHAEVTTGPMAKIHLTINQTATHVGAMGTFPVP